MTKNHVMKKLKDINSSSFSKQLKVENSYNSLNFQKKLIIQNNNLPQGSSLNKIYII